MMRRALSVYNHGDDVQLGQRHIERGEHDRVYVHVGHRDLEKDEVEHHAEIASVGRQRLKKYALECSGSGGLECEADEPVN